MSWRGDGELATISETLKRIERILAELLRMEQARLDQVREWLESGGQGEEGQ